jgi:hypothetical protein
LDAIEKKEMAFFCSSGVWIQSLTLDRQALFHLSHSAIPFFVCAGYFQIGSCELFGQAGFKLWSSWSLPPK